MLKESKHIRLLFFILVAVFMTVGCGKKTKPKDSLEETVQTELYDKGMELIGKLNQISNDYGYMVNSGLQTDVEPQYNKLVTCQYAELSDVFRVSHLDEATNTFVSIAGQTMSRESIQYFKNNIVEDMGNMIMSYASNDSGALALTSTLFYRTCFYNKSVTTSEAFIYCYKDSYPVIVSFVPGDGGAVSVKASYLLVDDMINMEPEELADCVRGYFNATSLERITK